MSTNLLLVYYDWFYATLLVCCWSTVLLLVYLPATLLVYCSTGLLQLYCPAGLMLFYWFTAGQLVVFFFYG